jgi:FkbM family methyltransferase
MALWRFIRWQINTRLNPYPVVFSFTENSRLLVWKGLTGATGNVYCGLHEFEDMGFLLHFLRPDELFIDIGANIGSYTILAVAEVKARSISIEPVPETFKNLVQNIKINNIESSVSALNIGIGRTKTVLKFTQNLDTTNHVVADDFENGIEVPIQTLDSICNGQEPSILKIDVEGFEAEVIYGGKSVLGNKSLKAIIIELNGSGRRYGYNDSSIHQSLKEFGFQPCRYDPFKRTLETTESFGQHNTIYVREIAFVRDRLSKARPFIVQGKEF